jgi:hypothetical protein
MTETNELTKKERIALLVYFPVHLLLLPLLLGLLYRRGMLSESLANFAVYATGALYMFIVLGRFLRREFDPFCDKFLPCVLQIGGSYLAILAFNALFSVLLMLLTGKLEAGNPNNETIFDLAEESPGAIRAMGIFLAPVVEELLFRAGLFGTLRKKSRVLAYIVSILAFSVYHVWSYAIQEPRYALYVIQYIPVSWLLARCYEKTRTIWTPIFLHMVVNAVSIAAMEGLKSL